MDDRDAIVGLEIICVSSDTVIALGYRKLRGTAQWYYVHCGRHLPGRLVRRSCLGQRGLLRWLAGCGLLGLLWLSAVTTAHAGRLLPGSPWLSAERAADAGHLPPASAPGGARLAPHPGPVGCQRPHRALLRVHVQLPIPIQA